METSNVDIAVLCVKQVDI